MGQEMDVSMAVSRLTAIWREVLMEPAVTPDTSFLDMGGDSLMAVRLRGAIRDALAKDLTLEELFDSPSPNQIAPYVMAAPTWSPE